MAETKRCPHCRGLNPAGAEWCGQCLERFAPPAPPMPEVAPPVPESAPGREAAPEPESPPPDVLTDPLFVSPDAAPVAAVAGISPAPAPAPRPAAVGSRHGAFTVREHGVVWTCSRCETENPLDAQVCEVCGTTMADVVHPPAEHPQRDPGMAAMLSLFFPGAGHGYLGMWGQAVARGVLSLWVILVVLVSVFQRGQGGSTMIGIVFAVVATALWAAAAHDAYREARNEPTMALLKGKVFLYLVLGLLVLLMVLLTASGLSARA